MHRITAGIVLISFALGLSFGDLHAQSAADKITLGTITLSLNNLPIYIAQDKKPLLIRFLRAILRADQFIHNQKEETVAIIVKRFKYNEKHSEASWRYYINNNAIPKDGEINAKGMDKVLQLLQEDGTLASPLPKAEKYVDMSYLAEVRRTLQ